MLNIKGKLRNAVKKVRFPKTRVLWRSHTMRKKTFILCGDTLNISYFKYFFAKSGFLSFMFKHLDFHLDRSL